MADVLPSPSTSSERARSSDPGHQGDVRHSGEVVCRATVGPEEFRAHLAVRHAVFVTEQGIFDDSDLDAHDADERTVWLLGLVDGVPAGAVRLWPHDDAHWQGDRLAVLPDYRHVGLGRPLVRLAVRTAAERGGEVMTAHIQLPNVRFFHALGWSAHGGPEDYLGVAHQHMSIGLR